MSPSLRSPVHVGSDIRLGLVFAALMLAIPWLSKWISGFGWVDARDFSGRALMVILAAYIVATGNTIPKRLIPRACVNADPGAVQAYLRLAGWTWVLAGLALGLVSVTLSRRAAATATFLIMPLGILLIAFGWLRLYRTRRPAA